MDTSEVFKSGGINIPNPNYNPKSKRIKKNLIYLLIM